MSLISRLSKPEYVFRPAQLLRRALRSSDGGGRVRTAWGARLTIHPNDQIGRSIANTGVYDLIVSEALWRLTDVGDVAVDAGANIGYMTSLLAARGARVFAFEPHPEIFKLLRENAPAGVEVLPLALSDLNGQALLSDHSDDNHGIARLSDDGKFPVECRRLDSFDIRARILKLDVEGHELQVLKGADLEGVRDIVFEENADLQNHAAEYLESCGFEVFSLSQSFFGPLLRGPFALRARPWEAPSYLATRDSARALRRLRARGWKCIS